LNTFEAVLHSAYLYLKILAAFGVISVFGSQQEATKIEKSFAPGHKTSTFLWEASDQCRAKPLAEHRKTIEVKGEFKKVPLDPRVPDKTVCIGTEMSQEEETKLLSFLEKNYDVFTWSTSNLVGVSRDVIEHRLQVIPCAKSKKQKLHKMVKEKVEAVKVEV
jgi:hypothetical protein